MAAVLGRVAAVESYQDTSHGDDTRPCSRIRCSANSDLLPAFALVLAGGRPPLPFLQEEAAPHVC
jgi:hypothetical protein